MPTSQKLIPQNTSFFIAQKAIFLQVNKFIFQLTKYEHKDVRESINSDDSILSSIGLAE